MTESLSDAIKAIRKKYGNDSIMRLGDGDKVDIERLPTGIGELDRAMGGGVPIGRTVEIFGPESSGKTTLSLYMAAEIQKTGRAAAIVDMEHALDIELAAAYGINVKDLYIAQPSSGEEAIDIMEALARTGEFGIIILDSVAALAPSAELESEMDQQHMGLHGRMMSKAMRKLTAVCAKNRCTVVFINQLREKIGVMFGNPETTPGGRALKFYSSLRIEVRAGEKIMDQNNVQIGHTMKCRVVKNKTAAPFGTAEIPLIYGVGIDKYTQLFNEADREGVIERKKAWITFDGKSYQGKNEFINLLKEDSAFYEKIRGAIAAKKQQENSL